MRGVERGAAWKRYSVVAGQTGLRAVGMNKRRDYHLRLTMYGSSPSVATNLTFNGLDPVDVTSPRMKDPSPVVSVRGMRMIWEGAMALEDKFVR